MQSLYDNSMRFVVSWLHKQQCNFKKEESRTASETDILADNVFPYPVRPKFSLKTADWSTVVYVLLV